MHNQIETFKIAVRKFAPFEAAMQYFWDQYCQISGCKLKLELVVMDLHELHARTIAQKGLANGDFDIAHISTDWVLEGYANHDFEVLNPYLNKNIPEGFPRGWSKSLLGLQRFGWEVVGLPFHDGPECFIYRKDLFEDETEKANYLTQFGKALAVPKTWEDFHQVAQFFNRPADNLYGSIFACYPDGHNTVFDFCLQLWTRGGALVDQNGFIKIDTRAAIDGLDFYRKIVNDKTAVHPQSPKFESVAAGNAFMQGEAAMMINWFGFAAMCEVDSNSKVKGKVDVELLPAAEGKKSASLNVYWLYTIGKGSKNKAIAYDFLRFALAEEQDKQLTLAGGIGCRISTWKDQEINEIIPYYHKLEALHEVANMLPQKKNWAEIAAIIDQMVLQAMNTDTPTEDLIKEAQYRINEIDK
ncbi:extracellular solute-binding protein [Pedobacter endophyticus]|uniref:Extracellular solute-binding protein n=1 Tax=Pedobacter endophyticus TaxID=2789740 RepID=A0A7S9L0H3_9SPHI|nr:extracellular solute-binding protein [Pedobacter endophyticus]QPH40210.1 extracellular solute-binding protein [Pedobacter endophyticus]